MRPKGDSGRIDAAIARIAGQQHGVVTIVQLEQLGSLDGEHPIAPRPVASTASTAASTRWATPL